MCLEFLTKIHLFHSGDLVFIGNVLAELFDIHIIWELEPIIVSKLYLGMCCGVGKIRLLSRNRSSSSPHFFFSTCLQKAVFLFFFFWTSLIITILCLLWASGNGRSICKAGSRKVFPGRQCCRHGSQSMALSEQLRTSSQPCHGVWWHRSVPRAGRVLSKCWGQYL